MAILLSVLALAGPHGWTLPHARQVLAARTYPVTDTSEPDRPHYELKLAPRALGRGFVYNGNAVDTLTDTSIRVRFLSLFPA